MTMKSAKLAVPEYCELVSFINMRKSFFYILCFVAVCQLIGCGGGEEQRRQLAELEEQNRTLQMQLEESRKLNAKNLVALHVQRGVVSAGEVESLEKLALLSYGDVEKMLGARQVPQVPESKEDPKDDQGKQLAAQLQELQGSPAGAEDERKGWNYLEWVKKDPRGLAAMEKSEPERFKQLCAAFEAESREKGLAV